MQVHYLRRDPELVWNVHDERNPHVTERNQGTPYNDPAGGAHVNSLVILHRPNGPSRKMDGEGIPILYKESLRNSGIAIDLTSAKSLATSAESLVILHAKSLVILHRM